MPEPLFPPTLRPFGRAEDLEIDLGRTDRPALITALLAQCGVATNPEGLWAMPVASRTAALACVVAMTDASSALTLTARCPGEDCGEALDASVIATTHASALTLTARCPGEDCGEALEVQLPLGLLTDAATGEGAIDVALGDERAVKLRRPTGADQRAWHSRRFATRREAIAAMLDTLAIEGRVAPDDDAALDAVSAAMAAADPLVAFHMTCACPACGAEHDIAVDLDGLMLARLSARQRALERDIHRLASHYGWTEDEILAIPAARRARYVHLIDEDGVPG